MDFYESPMKKKTMNRFWGRWLSHAGTPRQLRRPRDFPNFPAAGVPGVPEKDRNNPTQISHNLS